LDFPSSGVLSQTDLDRRHTGWDCYWDPCLSVEMRRMCFPFYSKKLYHIRTKIL
jgi:hypothetical protein